MTKLLQHRIEMLFFSNPYITTGGSTCLILYMSFVIKAIWLKSANHRLRVHVIGLDQCPRHDTKRQNRCLSVSHNPIWIQIYLHPNWAFHPLFLHLYDTITFEDVLQSAHPAMTQCIIHRARQRACINLVISDSIVYKNLPRNTSPILFPFLCNDSWKFAHP